MITSINRYTTNSLKYIPKYFFFVLILALPFAKGYSQPGNTAQSQNIWKRSSPEEQGMNSLVFANAIKKIAQDSTNIHSLLVIKNNHIVLDASFYPFKNSYVHDLASVTKSVTSLLIGIAIDNRFIQSENEPIVNYFPDYKIKNDTLQTVTIKDLLNMSSGFQCSGKNGEKELTQMRTSGDWVRFMLMLHFANNPDKQFSYCSGNFYLLAEILQRATKMSCQNFAKKYLFTPLGFGKSYWSKNDKGVNFGWGDLHISIYDFAKIGSLVLNDGVWNGKQIISKHWMAKIKPIHKTQGSESYGYGWWFDSENPDEIQAIGRGGQRLFIFKDRNLVIATNGGGGYDSGHFDDLALQAIKAYNKSETQYSILQQQIKSSGLPDTSNLAGTGFPINELNKSFVLDKNEMSLKSIGFEKRKTDYYIILHFIDNSKEEYPIGMNNQYKVSNEYTFGLPIAIKGRWTNEVLYIDYNRLCRIENYKITIIFKGTDSIELTLTEASKRINQTITGKTL